MFSKTCSNSQKQPSEVFFEKRYSYKNFAKFTGKHLCWGLFFNKVVVLKPATLLIKRFQHRCFPVNFAKFLRMPFLQNNSVGLLLNSGEISEIGLLLQLLITKVILTIKSKFFLNPLMPGGNKKVKLT